MTREEKELAIVYLEEMKETYIEGVGYERHPLPEYYAIETAIKALDQEPKTGHWIEDENEMKVWCSECGEESDNCSKCCPVCGARMEESEE